MNTYICSKEQFEGLLQILKKKGYRLRGPTIRDDAVVYEEIDGAADLPIGWRDEQGPGKYRLKREGKSYFAYLASPHCWNQFLFPPKETLWTAQRDGNKILGFKKVEIPDEKWAFIGVLACDLAAIAVLAKVFDSKIEHYEQFAKRLKNTFIVAINCVTSVSTCFCSSMGTGPDAKGGFDLSLTEIADERRHHFLISSGSEEGEAICKELELTAASDAECQEGAALVRRNGESLQRSVENNTVQEKLAKSYNYKQWEDVAKRCLNCANCTMACPTCFCTAMSDHVNMSREVVERVQKWDSCFNLSHSYIHGAGSLRTSGISRYRQWLTHKFGTWWDQFGTSGCVGCGRCITWCPVGIDVTEELAKLDTPEPPPEK